jgi:hypothetical protein
MSGSGLLLCKLSSEPQYRLFARAVAPQTPATSLRSRNPARFPFKIALVLLGEHLTNLQKMPQSPGLQASFASLRHSSARFL